MVIYKRRPCHGGTRGRFHRIYIYLLAVYLVIYKWKCQTREITAPACAADHYIRIFTDLFHLKFGLQANDSLVEHHVIKNAAKGIAGLSALVGDSRLDGLADGYAKAARGLGILFKDLASRVGFLARTWDAYSTPGLHH